MTDKQIIANTLRWCNAQRRKKNRKPLAKLPRGEKSNGESCPCGKATALQVGRVNFWEAGGYGRPIGELPVSVQEFVRKFDNGELPEYDIAAA